MKTKLSILIITLLVATIGKSQVNNSHFFYERQLVKITVWDVSGLKSSGYLFRATDSTLVISNLQKDSLLFYNAGDIYRIKVLRKSGLFFTGSIFLSLELLNLMLSPFFVAQTDAFINIPFLNRQPLVIIPTLVSTLFVDKIYYDFICNSNIEKYKLVYPLLKKYSNRLSNSELNNQILDFEIHKNSIIESKVKNDKKINDIKKPFPFFYPDRIARFHFTFSYNINYLLFAKNNLCETDYFKEFDTRKKFFNDKYFDYKISLNITKKIRLTFNRYDIWFRKDFNNNEINFDILCNSFSLEYILKPVNRSLKSRNEFIFGLGISKLDITYQLNYSDYTYTSWQSDHQMLFDWQNFEKYALKPLVSYDLYLSRNISIHLELNSEICTNSNYKSITFNQYDKTIINISGGKFNFSNFKFIAGVNIHL